MSVRPIPPLTSAPHGHLLVKWEISMVMLFKKSKLWAYYSRCQVLDSFCDSTTVSR